MLKIVHTACLTLASCLLLSPVLAPRADAQTQQEATAPLLSPDAFSALNPDLKYLYLEGVTAHWTTVADGRDFAFLQAAVDAIVTPSGTLSIPINQALPFGKAILLVYRATGKSIYYQAANQLRTYLQPQQDKGDMSTAPFLADFGVTAGDASAAEQAADILLRIDTTGRDLETGLLHGSSPTGALSRNTVYALDLLQTIDRLPVGFHHRRGLAEALNKTVSALIARQDNHAVWQTPGQPTQTLLLNAFIVARAVRLGELAGSDATLAKQMAEAVHSATLSPADEGARLLAESEADQVSTQAYGQGKTVVADSWFTAEPRENPVGKPGATLAKWNDDSANGLSFLGYAFKRYGMQTDVLRTAPTAAGLSSAQVYVVASPANTFSHDITKQDADAVETWVKEGGVLILFQNKEVIEKSSNLNILSDRFGMHFNQSDGTGRQDGREEQNVVVIPPGNNVFSTSRRLSLQGNSTLTLKPQAHSVLQDNDGAKIAVASVGRGTVLAIADPWLLNEFLDGRKSSPSTDNFRAAIDLAGWILKQTQQ